MQILDQIGQLAEARRAGRDERFAALVQALIDDDIDAEGAEEELDDLRRTPAELAEAVDLRRKRLGWGAQMQAADAAEDSIRRIDDAARKADAELQAAQQRHQAAIAPLAAQREAAIRQLADAKRARQRLLDSAPQAARLAEIRGDLESLESIRQAAVERRDSAKASIGSIEQALADTSGGQREAMQRHLATAKAALSEREIELANVIERRAAMLGEQSELVAAALVP